MKSRLKIFQGSVYTCRFRFEDWTSGVLGLRTYETSTDARTMITFPSFLPSLCISEFPGPDELVVLRCGLDNRRLVLNLVDETIQSIDLVLSAEDTSLLSESRYVWNFWFNRVGKIANTVFGMNRRVDFTTLQIRDHEDTSKIIFYSRGGFSMLFETVFSNYLPGDNLVLRRRLTPYISANLPTEFPGYPSVVTIRSTEKDENTRTIILTHRIPSLVYPNQDAESVLVGKVFLNPLSNEIQASGTIRVEGKVYCG